MDTIQYLFSALIRLAVALIVVAVIWWLVSTLFPMLNAKNLFSLGGGKTASGDWLPAPRNGLLNLVKVPTTDTAYETSEPFNGYESAYTDGGGVNFVSYYTSDGRQVITSGNKNQQKATTVTTQDSTVTYIRNLSLYQGGHLYTGLTFTGDARDVMFKNGRFPIIIVDSSQRVVGTLTAEATTNWAIPGWVKFQAKINGVLPNRVPCMLIFEQSMATNQYQYSYGYEEKREPIRVTMPAQCN